MTFNEYQRKAITTLIKEKHPLILLSRLTLGLVGEAGEVAEAVKKFLRGDYKTTSLKQNFYNLRNKIKKELGDLLWYLAVLADSFDIDLLDVAEMNIKKLQSRKKRNKIKGEGDDR